MATDADKLDAIAQAAQRGEAPIGELIETFLDCVVVVPSRGDIVSSPESFQPVVLEIEGDTLVAVFSSAAAAAVTDRARYAATIPGREVLRLLAPGLGLLVTTDNAGFEIRPELARSIREWESRPDAT